MGDQHSDKVYKPTGISNYEISNYGKIRNADGRHLLYRYYQNGYERVSLHCRPKHKSVMIHILIAKAFIPNPDNLPVVDHINSNRSDNRVENLRWSTYSDNAKQGKCSGIKVGVYDNQNKQPENLVREFKNFASVAEQFKIDYQSIFAFEKQNKPLEYQGKLVWLKRLSENAKPRYVDCLEEGVWREIDGFPLYKVNNKGDVANSKTLRLLNPTNDDGYLKVNIVHNNGKYYQKPVHRLVAQQFIPNASPEITTIINHKDGVRSNNHIDNLEWTTYSENTIHSIRQLGKKYKGRPVCQLDTNGVIIARYDSIAEAARKLAASPASICGALKGYRKTSCGFKWQYDDIKERPSKRQKLETSSDDESEKIPSH